MNNITIILATIFQNGGDATRAIEIAKIIRKFKPDNYNLRIVFISHGSKFEQNVIDSGFELYHAEPHLEGIRYQDDFQTRFGELVGNEKLSYELLQGEIKAYHDINPDMVIYGFWPIGSIAKRIAVPDVKGIAFLPLPLTHAFLDEPLTFPDELFLSRLPLNFQRKLIKILPKQIKENNPALRHSLIRSAAEKIGWEHGTLTNIFEMLKSDIYLVNDLPVYYQTNNYEKNVVFTGPIYAMEKSEQIEDEGILHILDKSNKRKKLFCTLGSSGSKKELLEVIKMLNTSVGLKYSGIVLSPASVCPIEEASTQLKNPNIYITDKFVPAKQINKQVDAVICHGGQGTLQTAITSATPIIGVATQPEQKVNLEHIEQFGSAIRIPYRAWNHKIIGRELERMFSNYKTFKMKAELLKAEYEAMNPEKIIGECVWKQLAVKKPQ